MFIYQTFSRLDTLFDRAGSCFRKFGRRHTFDQTLQSSVQAAGNVPEIKHNQTLFGNQTFPHLETLFDLPGSCLRALNEIWGTSDIWSIVVKFCPNGKCLAIKHHETLFGDQTYSRLESLFKCVGSCQFDKQLISMLAHQAMFYAVWSPNPLVRAKNRLFVQTCLIPFGCSVQHQHVSSTNIVWSCLSECKYVLRTLSWTTLYL